MMATLRLLVPMYNPAPLAANYQTLINAKQSSGIPMSVIINPANGAYSSTQGYSAAVEQAVTALQNAGIDVLGYMYTGRGTISASVVEYHISLYKSWYHTNGIFLDEFANVQGQESYYSGLTAYAHSLGMYTMGNPGASFYQGPSYMSTIDYACIIEAAGIPTPSYVYSFAEGSSGADASRYAVILYSTGGDPGLAWFQAVSQYISFVWATDQPANYTDLPTYFNSMVSELKAVNGSSGGGGGGGGTVAIKVDASVSGSSIGVNVNLLDHNGSLIWSTTTPVTMYLTSGTEYAIQVGGYGSDKFGWWSWNGGSNSATNNPLYFVAGQTGSEMTAYYTNPVTTTAITSYAANVGFINGLHILLYDANHTQINSDYTPIWWGLTPGATYGLLAQSYGPYTFSAWNTSDWTQSWGTNPFYFTAGSQPGYIAYYTQLMPTIPMTIGSTYNGTSDSGHYILLTDSNGSTLKSGYTPVTFTLNVGSSYGIVAQNYGSYVFSQWSWGLTQDPLYFSVVNPNAPLTINAEYNGSSPLITGNSKGVAIKAKSGKLSLSVTSQRRNGKAFNGYPVQVKTPTGTLVGSGVTPYSTTLNAGTYSVYAGNGSLAFIRWSDGIATNPRTINLTGNTSLIAVY